MKTIRTVRIFPEVKDWDGCRLDGLSGVQFENCTTCHNWHEFSDVVTKQKRTRIQECCALYPEYMQARYMQSYYDQHDHRSLRHE